MVSPSFVYSQRIENTISFREISYDSYIRFSYDNDFFTSSDRYYSQGIQLEYVTPAFKKNPFNFLLLKSRSKPVKNGIALDHMVFTPSTIRSNDVIPGDRPFAACLTMGSFSMLYDSTHSMVYSSSISFGVIGPLAGGEAMQKGIHDALDNIEPLGWEHQIKNDIIINYEVSLEKQLYNYRNYFALNGTTGIRVGTLNDNINMGINFQLGRINPIFKSVLSPKLQIYLFSESLVNFIGYNATLQGGMFNRSSPYTFKTEDLSRVTLQQNLGIVLKWERIYLEYFQTGLTQEFETGKSHRWGGIKMGCAF